MNKTHREAVTIQQQMIAIKDVRLGDVLYMPMVEWMGPNQARPTPHQPIRPMLCKVTRMTDGLITLHRVWMPADLDGYLRVNFEIMVFNQDAGTMFLLVDRVTG